MKRFTMVIAVLAGTLLGIALVLGSTALAQGPAPTTGQPMMGGRMMGGRGQAMNGPAGAGMAARGGGAQGLVAVAAEQLAMDQAALLAELNQGKTIVQVAQERNADPLAIVEAFVAPRAARLDQQVLAGNLTHEEADARVATMRSHVTTRIAQPLSAPRPGDGPGAGVGPGDGDCRPLGGSGGGQAQRGNGPGRSR